MRKYSQVVQRYYVQYLVGFDVVQLSQSIQSLYGNQQDHYHQDPSYVIFQSIINTISALSVKQGTILLIPIPNSWFLIKFILITLNNYWLQCKYCTLSN